MSDDPTPSSRDTHHISGGGDRYEALMAVLEHQASQSARDRAREAEQLRRQRETRDRPYGLVAVLLVFTAWIWLLPPAFLRVEAPPAPPVQEEEAALRFLMYVQAQRIKAYRQETGEYPTRLEEAGPPLPGMRYMRLADELYQLTGVTERLTLTFRSDLPLEEFVGSGAAVLERPS